MHTNEADREFSPFTLVIELKHSCILGQNVNTNERRLQSYILRRTEYTSAWT
jgi:hypothetical protein